MYPLRYIEFEATKKLRKSAMSRWVAAVFAQFASALLGAVALRLLSPRRFSHIMKTSRNAVREGF